MTADLNPDITAYLGPAICCPQSQVGLFRPITLWPYPSKALADVASRVRTVLTVELSNGQMVEDVRLAVNGSVPVEFYGRVGGNVTTVEEIHKVMFSQLAAAL